MHCNLDTHQFGKDFISGPELLASSILKRFLEEFLDFFSDRIRQRSDATISIGMNRAVCFIGYNAFNI